jgi:rRNA maturation RNase YbeY
MISFQSDIKFILKNKREHRNWLKKTIHSENKKEGNIVYVFKNDEGLLSINEQFLKHDTYTDVITFDYTCDEKISGDIIISIDRVRENAKIFNVSFDEELRRVMAHGILHLCGYKDKTKQELKIMRKKEDKALELFHVEHGVFFNKFFVFILFFIFQIQFFGENGVGDRLVSLKESILPPHYYENVLASPFLPESLTFAGEKVPLHIYWVRERLEKELTIVVYNHSRSIMILKRSPRFFSIIEQILKDNDIPEDFKYLCVAESGLENVVSPAKAAGYWQFMENTAKIYSLTVNDEVDERYHLSKSTRSACQYLKNAQSRFGSWTLAAAAYNMGENGVSKAIEKQLAQNYWDLYLNQETSRYIYRILAYKLLFEFPKKYGVKITKKELYYSIPTKEYKVTGAIDNLYLFAKEQGITYLELKMLNPWLRDIKLTKNPTEYTILLPQKPGCHFLDLLENVDKENDLF